MLNSAVNVDPNRSIKNVENKSVLINQFCLEDGEVLPQIQIAYETYGVLNTAKSNVILVTHGYMSSHHAAGFYRPGHAPFGVSELESGWWDALIGPNKAIDTNHFFVISSNMLGSCFGSTNPKSIDPKTNKPYGPNFPKISMVDIVSAQRALLRALGIEHLVAVVGLSYGGYIAFQWAVTYPTEVDGIVVSASAPKGIGNSHGVEKIKAQFAQDRNWNDGWYYENGGINETLTKIRIAALKQYGIEQQLSAQFNEEERHEALRKLVQPWAQAFDGHSLLILRHAADYFDAQKDFKKIRAKVLYVLSKTDQLFPPSIATNVLSQLAENGVDATYFELDSQMGHLAPCADASKWSVVLEDFLKQFSKCAVRHEITEPIAGHLEQIELWANRDQ